MSPSIQYTVYIELCSLLYSVACVVYSIYSDRGRFRESQGHSHDIQDPGRPTAHRTARAEMEKETLTLLHSNTATLSQSHTSRLSHSQTLTLSQCHTLILLHCHFLTLSHSQTATHSNSIPLILSHSRTLTRSHSYTATMSHYQFLALPLGISDINCFLSFPLL